MVFSFFIYNYIFSEAVYPLNDIILSISQYGWPVFLNII